MLKFTQEFQNKLNKTNLRFAAKMSLIDQGVNPNNAKLIVIDNNGKARKVVKIRKADTNA